MMTDTAGLAHAARRHDDGAAAYHVDGFAFLHAFGELEVLSGEGAAVFFHLLHIALVLLEHLRHLGGERRVDKDRHLRYLAAVHQRIEVEQQFLRALHGEGRNDNVAACFPCGEDFVAQVLAAAFERVVRPFAVAIGAFDEDVVDFLRPVGVVVEGFVFGAEVARKQHMGFLAVFIGEFQFDRAGTEDVARVPVAPANAERQVEPCIEIDRIDEIETGFGMFGRIDRFYLRLAAVAVGAVQALHLAHLDEGGIGQHIGEQVFGCLRRINFAVKTLAHQFRQQAAVVDMGVGEQNKLNLPCVEAEIAVIQFPHRLRALVHAAVDQKFSFRHGDEVARTRDDAGGAAKLDLDGHYRLLPFQAASSQYLKPILSSTCFGSFGSLERGMRKVESAKRSLKIRCLLAVMTR